MTDQTDPAKRLFMALDALQQQGNTQRALNTQFPDEAARLRDFEQRVRQANANDPGLSEDQVAELSRLASWPRTLVVPRVSKTWRYRLAVAYSRRPSWVGWLVLPVVVLVFCGVVLL